MTDINRLIEEEARKEQWIDPCSTSCERQVAYSAFIDGANFILHQNRWRKVEEELPEMKEVKYQILIRIINIPTSATVWNIRNESDRDIIRKMTNSEWKPIT